MSTEEKIVMDDSNQSKLNLVEKVCGIIMPISGSEGYPAEHWSEVKTILEEVINKSGFVPNLVSDADDVGIIHNRIVNNIYNNPILVCDVSSKNPNVMFELGLRLAFDKATIIVRDNVTSYNFDTAPIEHLTYPKDLRYTSILSFKEKLKQKIESTYKASLDKDYSTFLKNFVQYKPKLDIEEVDSQKFIMRQLELLSREIFEIRKTSVNSTLKSERIREERNAQLANFTQQFIKNTSTLFPETNQATDDIKIQHLLDNAHTLFGELSVYDRTFIQEYFKNITTGK